MGFLQDFMGTTQARDIDRGRVRSRSELLSGRDLAMGQYDQAEGYFRPYAATGGAANQTWADLMGLSGADARTRAQAMYTSDPIFTEMGNRALRGVSRTVAATGQTGAGVEAGSRLLHGGYTAHLDRLLAGSGEGLKATGAMAGVRQHRGDTEFGTGQQLAGIETNAANARAAARSTGINNLLGLGSLAVGAYTGMRFPRVGGGGAPPGFGHGQPYSTVPWGAGP